MRVVRRVSNLAVLWACVRMYIYNHYRKQNGEGPAPYLAGAALLLVCLGWAFCPALWFPEPYRDFAHQILPGWSDDEVAFGLSRDGVISVLVGFLASIGVRHAAYGSSERISEIGRLCDQASDVVWVLAKAMVHGSWVVLFTSVFYRIAREI